MAEVILKFLGKLLVVGAALVFALAALAAITAMVMGDPDLVRDVYPRINLALAVELGQICLWVGGALLISVGINIKCVRTTKDRDGEGNEMMEVLANASMYQQEGVES